MLVHVNHRDRSNNNMIERLHGTIRQRNKVMRGLDDEETARTMMDGLRIYDNFIRPHTALNGKTPAKSQNRNIQGRMDVSYQKGKST
jgi:transposase-like protein